MVTSETLIFIFLQDLFSYSVEQSKGDTNNVLVVVMHHDGLDLHAAAEFVADMCRESIDRFVALRAQLPSWEVPAINRDVEQYVRGLADWIVGSLEWSFTTERYFGKAVEKVRATMTVEIHALKADGI